MGNGRERIFKNEDFLSVQERAISEIEESGEIKELFREIGENVPNRKEKRKLPMRGGYLKGIRGKD